MVIITYNQITDGQKNWPLEGNVHDQTLTVSKRKVEEEKNPWNIEQERFQEQKTYHASAHENVSSHFVPLGTLFIFIKAFGLGSVMISILFILIGATLQQIVVLWLVWFQQNRITEEFGLSLTIFLVIFNALAIR